mmetsp:Transcript_116543/g.324804  ORF Transcript_116543/g.324804 Transcript_116543/m.324804 type:complete len:427 (-) Transcript_116543:274-1554(-)
MWMGQCTTRTCRPCCFADPSTDTIKVEANKIGSQQGGTNDDALAIAEPPLNSWPCPVGEQLNPVKLLSRLHVRLMQEGLEFHDLPDVGDRDFLLLLAELGFESALERAKLRKAVRDLLALRCPSDTKRSITTLSTLSPIDDEAASQLSSEFVPFPGAYYTGEQVEYYSKRLRLWSPAEVTAEARSTGQDVVYSATVLPQNQEFYDVGLAALRPPFKEGEPCEVFVPGSQWLQAVTSSCQQGKGTEIFYRVMLLEGQGGAVEVPASRLRRRFPPGSLVTVYRGPGLGWNDAMVVSAPAEEGAADVKTAGGEVAEGALVATSLRSDEASLAPRAISNAPSLFDHLSGAEPEPEMFTEISLCLETGDTLDKLLLVPSYLLRFRPDYLSQYALWSLVRQEAVSAGRSDSQSVLMKPDSFAVPSPRCDQVV